jgi:hypothetical protein
VILGIYRSPSNSNADYFISSLSSHLDTIKSNKNIVITGDININIADKIREQTIEQANRSNYLDMMAMHGLLPGHILPTRESACLDHFMLKLNNKFTKATTLILDTTITDHAMIVLNMCSSHIPKCCNKTKIKINFENAYSTLLNDNLST